MFLDRGSWLKSSLSVIPPRSTQTSSTKILGNLYNLFRYSRTENTSKILNSKALVEISSGIGLKKHTQ